MTKQTKNKNANKKPKPVRMDKPTRQLARTMQTIENQNERKMVKGVKGVPEIFRSLARPFSNPSCHWPDQDCSPSGRATSYLHATIFPYASSGTSTAHSTLWLFNPYPASAIVEMPELGVGSKIFSEVNATGTALIGSRTDVPNLAALLGGGNMKIRCTGIGVRLSYNGTELNKSAIFKIGLIPSSGQAYSVATTGTILTEATSLFGTPTATQIQIRDSMSHSFDGRIPTDGCLEAIWKPARVPSYQEYTFAEYPVTTCAAAALSTPNSVYNAPAGGKGIEAGQNVLAIFLQGDSTTAVNANGNNYEMDIVWHWELTPSSPAGVTYDIEASPCNTQVLDASLNALAVLPSGRTIRDGEPDVGFP